MGAFRWIQMSSLLTLMLQSAGTDADRTYLTVKKGTEVTLPCGNRRDPQHNCDQISWFLSDRTKTKTIKLVERGKIHPEAKTLSDRLSLTENCSLVLRNVTEGEVGQYSCRRPDIFVVLLSLINMEEQKNLNTITWFCSVLEYDDCSHELEWLYEGKEGKPSDVEISPRSCSSTVTFQTSHLHQKPDLHQLLRCKVTNSFTNKVQLFPFIPQLSEKSLTTTATKVVKETTNKSVPTSTPQTSFPWWYIIVPLCLAALLIIALVILRWKQAEAKKKQADDSRIHHYEAVKKEDLNPDSAVDTVVQQTSQTTTDPEEVSYASINFSKAKKKKNNVSESVIYSSVGTSSSSAGVSSDANCLYSTLSK